MPPKNPWPASAATDARAVPPRFAVRPLSLRAANAFVQEHHRHHRPVQGGKFSLALEFAMLLGAALLVGQGAQGWAWFYALYSAVNAASAWLILSGRI